MKRSCLVVVSRWLFLFLVGISLLGSCTLPRTPDTAASGLETGGVIDTSITPSPTQSMLSEADTIAIYATVIRRLCTHDDSFGGTYRPEIIYLVRQTDDRVGDPKTPRTEAVVLAEAVQAGLAAALADLAPSLVWVDSHEDVPKDPKTGVVEGHGVIVTVGNIHPQEDGMVHVPASIYVASLAAAGQTYVLQQENGAWVVKGNTGVRWMS